MDRQNRCKLNQSAFMWETIAQKQFGEPKSCEDQAEGTLQITA